MRKNVYLYELDSVRTSKPEVLAGQQAMFREIIQRGNCVVITYNQLTDAPAFLQALKFPETYEQMLHLFSNGSIKVSRYIDRAPGSDHHETRTAAQYVLHAISKALGAKAGDADKFIFSGLPIKRGNEAMLKTLRDAIMFSDPARISDLIRIAQDPQRKGEREALGIQELTERDLNYILRYVNLILRLSREPLAHIPAKPVDRDKVWSFTDYLDAVLAPETAALAGERRDIPPQFAGAVSLLHRLKLEIEPHKQLSRSPWLALLQDMDGDDPAVLLAQIMINLCYNYTVEESILGVTKRFGSNEADFSGDFLDRLAEFWQEYLVGAHILHDKENPTLHIRLKDLPDWALAVRTMDEAAKIKKAEPRRDESEESLWRRVSRWGLGKKILSTLVYVPLFFIMDWAMNLLETWFTSPTELALPAVSELGPMFLSAVVTTFCFGLLSGQISRWITVPDISDTLHNLWTGFRDLMALRRVQNEGSEA